MERTEEVPKIQEASGNLEGLELYKIHPRSHFICSKPFLERGDSSIELPANWAASSRGAASFDSIILSLSSNPDKNSLVSKLDLGKIFDCW
jgi:hypothetical protein